MNDTLRRVKTFFLDILFPIFCVSCGRPETWLCQSCFSLIARKNEQECPACGRVRGAGTYCDACKNSKSLAALFVATHYEDPTMQKIIHGLKYQFATDLRFPCASLLEELFYKKRKLFPSATHIVVMPIPLHKRRKQERGFNQSELVAREFAQRIHMACDENSLTRTRYTKPQMTLSRQERIKNMQEDIFIYQGPRLQNKTVILIDDVATTTATLEAGARALKVAQPKKIIGFVLARTK